MKKSLGKLAILFLVFTIIAVSLPVMQIFPKATDEESFTVDFEDLTSNEMKIDDITLNYAKSDNSSTDGTVKRVGDATGDTATDIRDLLRTKKYLCNISAKIELDNCDFNNNCTVDAYDYSSLRKLLLGLEVKEEFAKISDTVNINNTDVHSDTSALKNEADGEFTVSSQKESDLYFNRTGKNFVAQFDASMVEKPQTANYSDSLAFTITNGKKAGKLFFEKGKVRVINCNGVEAIDEGNVTFHGYLDLSPNESTNNWGNSYTFKEDFNYGTGSSGAKGTYPLYVRLLIKKGNGAGIDANRFDINEVKKSFDITVGGEKISVDDLTWRNGATVDDNNGSLLDRTTGTYANCRAVMTSYLKVNPGDTITLKDENYSFVIYGHSSIGESIFEANNSTVSLAVAKDNDVFYVAVNGEVVLAQEWSNIFPNYNEADNYAIGLSTKADGYTFDISNVKIGTSDNVGDEYMNYKYFGNSTGKNASADARIMSYNLLAWSYAYDGTRYDPYPRIRGEIAQILKYRPDVVGLQEVDAKGKAALLAELIEKDSSYKLCGTSESKNFTLILYNSDTVEMTDSGLKAYTTRNNSETGFILWGKFKKKSDNKEFYVINTHQATSKGVIDSNTYTTEDSTYQIAQCEELKEFIVAKKTENIPCFIIGDFNKYYIPTGGNCYSDFINGVSFSEAYKTAAVKENDAISTWRTDWSPNYSLKNNAATSVHNRIIDHISYDSEKADADYYTVILNETSNKVSDHLPIYAEFTFK